MHVLHTPLSPHSRSRPWLRRAWFAASVALASMAHGQTTQPSTAPATPAAQPAANDPPPPPLAVQVNDDKLTLAVTRAPQIYLYGTLDADAPNRIEAMIRSGRIRAGSDIYLNSPAGDLAAGAALGRLFREAKMTTHLGVPRRNAQTPAQPREASCQGACALAYVGGLYRWAPTGNDHFAVQAPGDAPKIAADKGELAGYLRQMGFDPLLFGVTSHSSVDRTVWLSGDQMLATGIANNGYLPPAADYALVSGAPQLTLRQTSRDGERRITLLCKPDGLTFTAYYMLGQDRAQRIAARANRSYLEINEQPTLQGDRERISAVDQSLVISRPMPLAELDPLLTAKSMGAWLSDKGGNVRYGFTMFLDAVRNNLKDYGSHCEQAARASTAKS
ncbi:hypothetical protein [Dyella sp. C9]|uniref:hypothetical protein n=1 Tax=Dyella sp. C9 TaxID=2202154 RepID=UPI000DEF24AF|nr:hypothetical protein [Dyella sp. C9]